MVYRALTEYLKGREQRKPAPWWAVALPPAVFGASMLWEPTRLLACPLSIVMGFAMILIMAHHEVRAEFSKSAEGKLEFDEWIKQLVGYAKTGKLEERSHPRLIADFEACAALRQKIIDTLEGPEWDRLSENDSWGDVRKVCRETADSLMQDAIWAAKGAIRPYGGRKETFRRRCEDPEFASRSLSGVRLARERLATLLDEVHDEPFAGRGVEDALSRAQLELRSIREAESELRQYVGGFIDEKVE